MKGAKVFNLSRSYRYQSIGYYVSLLAEARGHRPLPDTATIQDLRSQTLTRFVSEDLFELIQKSLAPLQSKEFTLSIYFGRNTARHYDRLSLALFNLFPAPLLRARFVLGTHWHLQHIGPIAASEIPESHMEFATEQARQYFGGRRRRIPKRPATRYDLAILIDPDEAMPPSDAAALKKFTRAAEHNGFAVDFIERDDYGRLAEFDALFIRTTTAVNHYTYRFARRAAAEGLVVIDDPDSILRCTNKVYLAELLTRHRIRTPRSRIISRSGLQAAMDELDMPCVLKVPDGSFSQGVIKVKNHDEFRTEMQRLLEKSELIIAQEYLPTEFDWRVGILDRKPFYLCKYYMAGGHWQIVQRDAQGRAREGRTETLPLESGPPEVVETALKAANLLGDGLYGVDLKHVRGQCYVIEVNDNPSIEAGVEDAVLRDELYERVIKTFLARIEARKHG